MEHWQRFLMSGQIRCLFPSGRLVAPNAEEIVIDLEGKAEGPAEIAESSDDLLVVAGEDRTRLYGARDEGCSLAADHFKVVFNALHLSARTRGDINELPLAEA